MVHEPVPKHLGDGGRELALADGHERRLHPLALLLRNRLVILQVGEGDDSEGSRVLELWQRGRHDGGE